MSGRARPPRPDVLCIGAVLWDVIGRSGRPMAPGDDVPGRIRHIPGGVALNVAVALARMGMRPAVLGAVGTDPEGEALTAAARARGVETRYLHRSPVMPTDVYMAIEDCNGLVAAIADAHSLEAAGPAILAPLSDGRLGSDAAPWSQAIVVDGNLTQALLADVANHPALARCDLRVVPASPGKAERLRPLLAHPRATLYLNRFEAEILAGRPCPSAADAARELAAHGAARVLVTDGARAVALAEREQVIEAQPPDVVIARVTGAGDCFLAAHLAAESAGDGADTALFRAVAAAAAHVAGEDP